MTAISANDTGLSDVNRRSLLLAGPAALAGVALPSAAAALTPSPVMALFQEWKPISVWLNGPEGEAADEVEFNGMNEARIALEDRMMAEPAHNAKDVLAKMTAYTHFGEDELMSRQHLPQVWAEAREFIGAQA